MSASAKVTGELCAFAVDASFESLSELAIQRVTDAITDAIGVGLAGCRQPESEATAAIAESGKPATVLLGRPQRAGPLSAALYNGTAIHALDYDDTNHPSYAHPSAHLVPVLLSTAGDHTVTGADAIVAYAVGLEVDAWLGAVLNTGRLLPQLSGHYARGWHTTGTFGSLAASVAAANLLRLDHAQTAHAVAIAASTAAGLRVNFGSMVKPLHAGLAARNGLTAAHLAQRGLTGSPMPLEGRFGYLDVLGEGPQAPPVIGSSGTWAAESDYGLAIKPYPSCGATHPAIEAALAVRNTMDWRDMREIRVGVNEVASDILVFPHPRTPGEAKFSMPFCVAAALVRGTVNLATFADEALRDTDVRGIMRRIVVEVDDRVRRNPEHGAVVTVVDGAGRSVEHLVALARGKPERWLTSEERQAKFADCAAPVIGVAQAAAAFTQWQRLASASSLAGLCELLAQQGIP